MYAKKNLAVVNVYIKVTLKRRETLKEQKCKITNIFRNSAFYLNKNEWRSRNRKLPLGKILKQPIIKENLIDSPFIF